MKRIEISVHDGKLKIDFEGFPSDACSDEETLMRLLMAKMGVKTGGNDEKKKAEPEANHIAEREKT